MRLPTSRRTRSSTSRSRERRETSTLETLIRSAGDRSFLSLFRTLGNPENITRSVAQHAELIAALRSGDAVLANEHMREHIAAARDEALQLIRMRRVQDRTA